MNEAADGADKTNDLNDSKNQPAELSEPDEPRERNAGSFLVRVWMEEREIEGENPILRGYVRNLRSGKQEYFRKTDTLGDLVLRQFGEGGSPMQAEFDGRTARASEA